MSGREVGHRRTHERCPGSVATTAECIASAAPPGDCPHCRHPWCEHPGTGNDLDGMCGECAYEFEHDQRESPAPGCRLPCPPSGGGGIDCAAGGHEVHGCSFGHVCEPLFEHEAGRQP